MKEGVLGAVGAWEWVPVGLGVGCSVGGSECQARESGSHPCTFPMPAPAFAFQQNLTKK